jgi:hypothetical protein
MNRITLLGIAFLLFSFCGPTEAEIQSRIDTAIDEALVETTLTTTTQPPTTSTVTTIKLSDDLKSELALRYSKEFIDNYDKNWGTLLNFEIVEVQPSGYSIQ